MYDLLIGKNIILRRAKESDYKYMFENVWSDPDIYSNMLFKPTLNEKDAIERNKRSILFQKDNYSYYVALKDTDIPIGFAGVYEYEPNRYEERGICIAKKYHGLGYGSEVLELLLDLAFNKLDAKYFRYGYFIDNIKSKNLALKYNFKYNRTEEIIRPWDNEKKLVDLCLLSKDDYLKGW